MLLCLQISQTLYKPYVESTPLFKGCSAEFIQQIVSIPFSAKIMYDDIFYKIYSYLKKFRRSLSNVFYLLAGDQTPRRVLPTRRGYFGARQCS